MRGPAQCGTISGYHRHRRRGEPACELCRAALREYRGRIRNPQGKAVEWADYLGRDSSPLCTWTRSEMAAARGGL